MRIRNTFYLLAVFLSVLCNNVVSFCKEIDVPSEPEQLRLFFLKGYTSAKSVIDDVRIEYQMSRIPVNPIILSPAMREKLKITGSVEEFTLVEEYIQKNGKERWVFLNYGKSAPKEDVSYRAELVKTVNSPRFKVFDGQYILEYTSLKDSFTNVGRASLDTSNTGFFNLRGSDRYTPVKFFGYLPGRMPDDVLLSPHVEIEMKPEIIDGLLTYKVSALFEEKHEKQNYTCEMTYWLSPERSCLPVKIEVWGNGKFRRRLETKEFIEQLGVLSEIFMILGVVAPLFFVVIIAILAVISPDIMVLTIIMLMLTYVIMPILLVVMILLISTISREV